MFYIVHKRNNFPFPDGGDFTPVTPTIMFPVNSENGDTECFSVPINNDMSFEMVESFSLQIDSVEEGVILNAASTTVSILDDDSKSLLVSHAHVQKEELQGVMHCR